MLLGLSRLSINKIKEKVKEKKRKGNACEISLYLKDKIGTSQREKKRELGLHIN